MATKGNTGTSDVAVGLDNYGRFQILSAMAANSTVDSVSVYLQASTTYRIALYASSSASQVKTATMRLVHDFGAVTRGGTNGLETIAATGSPTLDAGEYPVIAIKGGTSNYMYISATEALPDGDVIATRRVYLDTASATGTAWSSSSGNDDDGDYPARTQRVTLTYTEGAALVKKLKLLAHSSAVGATGVAGVVFAAPTGGDITGAKIGEFTGAAFEASLESGQAVLKVDVADFGGEALTTSDTPVVLVRNGTYSTGVIDCVVIEE